VYVTHDQVEAMTMGDRIVIMKDGLIQQVGAPLEVYATPQNQFVAGFIGSPAMNFIPCTVTTRNGNLFFVAPGLALPVPVAKAKAMAAYKDKAVTMGLRPEDVHESTPQDAASSMFDARVEVVEPIGHEIFLDVTVGTAEIIARVSPDTPTKVGQTIKLAATVEKLHAFDPQTERAIGVA
jgi:multiple sugar transport system ATP-binding protein